MKNFFLFYIIFLLLQASWVYSQTLNQRERNLKTSSRSTSSRSTSSSAGGGGSSGGSSNSQRELSDGARIAIYVTVPLGICLMTILIAYACRRYRAKKIKEKQEQIQKQINKQIAQQTQQQSSQKLGEPYYFNYGQNGNNYVQYPQQYQYQVFPNSKNQTYY